MQLEQLKQAVELMSSLVIQQLCLDGLATDNTVQLIFADDEDFPRRVAEYACNTSCANPLHQAQQTAEQAPIATPDRASQSDALKTIFQSIQAWPQPTRQQWANTVTVANRISVLFMWLKSPAQLNNLNNAGCTALLEHLMLAVTKLLASLLAGMVVLLSSVVWRSLHLS